MISKVLYLFKNSLVAITAGITTNKKTKTTLIILKNAKIPEIVAPKIETIVRRKG